MNDDISTFKGIHPGLILDRKLKEKKLAKGRFAISIGEYPQTLTAITKGKRGMNIALALKIEKALNLQEGFLMTLQIHYQIKELKMKQQQGTHPDLSLLRSGLFWDTDLKKIDWQYQRRAVIERILERGNEEEIAEIRRFYGDAVVNEFDQKMKREHA